MHLTTARRSHIIFVILCLVGFWIRNAEAQGTPSIAIQRQGTGIRLTWGGGTLQSAAPPAGPWTAVSGAVSPLTVANVTGRKFYRVQGTAPATWLLTLAKNGTGTGTVRSTALGMVCGAECSRQIASGTVVTLEAVPDAGSTFGGWSGDGTGTTTRSVTMSAARTVTATFTAITTPGNPIINGGFEQGPLSGWTQQFGQLIYTSAELNGFPAHSGQSMARLGWDQQNHTFSRIGQRITMPASGPIYLNFWFWLYSQELCDVPYYDNFSVYINNQVIASNDRVCSTNSGSWQRYSTDLSAFAGQTVDLVFIMSSADTLSSFVLLDDISISSQPE